MDLVNPDDVTVTVEAGAPVWWVSGRRVEDPSVFVHRRVNPIAGRVQGLSPIAAHAETIGVSLASTRFGSQWFKDGAHPSAMLTNSEPLNSEQAETAKKRFLATLRGSREPVVLGKGWDYKALQINPNESQFLQTQGFSEAQCARIYGPGFAEVLGYESGGSMTYANVVDRRQDLLVLSMNRWLRRGERVLSLLSPAGQDVRLNRDALLEATTLQRYEAHASALSNGWRTVNEIRGIEDLPPVEWGSEPTGGEGRELSAAEVSQKVYLAVVNGVLSAEEARELINKAGADINPALIPKQPEGVPSGDADGI
jgi:HK97 family phage portal protein